MCACPWAISRPLFVDCIIDLEVNSALTFLMGHSGIRLFGDSPPDISSATHKRFAEGVRLLQVPTLLPFSFQSSSLPFEFGHHSTLTRKHVVLLVVTELQPLSATVDLQYPSSIRVFSPRSWANDRLHQPPCWAPRPSFVSRLPWFSLLFSLIYVAAFLTWRASLLRSPLDRDGLRNLPHYSMHFRRAPPPWPRLDSERERERESFESGRTWTFPSPILKSGDA